MKRRRFNSNVCCTETTQGVWTLIHKAYLVYWSRPITNRYLITYGFSVPSWIWIHSGWNSHFFCYPEWANSVSFLFIISIQDVGDYGSPRFSVFLLIGFWLFTLICRYSFRSFFDLFKPEVLSKPCPAAFQTLSSDYVS